MSTQAAVLHPEVAFQQVQPIETAYSGHRFRSRLEARHAVFLDALGVPYHYEAQGYVIQGLGPYLPDFRIPRWDLWLEVKPMLPTQRERDLLRSVAQASDSWGVVAAGMPSLRGGLCVVHAPSYMRGEGFASEGDGWRLAEDVRDPGAFWLAHDDYAPVILDVPRSDEEPSVVVTPQIIRAANAARAARFIGAQPEGQTADD